VSTKPGQRAKLERRCRYVGRAPLAQDRRDGIIDPDGVGEVRRSR
jgi:hypothetical protein